MGWKMAALLAAAVCAAPATAQEALSDAAVMALHDRLFTIDSHVDIGAGYGTARLDPSVLNEAQVNLPAMRVGGLDGAFFIVYTRQGVGDAASHAEAVEAAEEKYRGIQRMLRANPGQIALARTADEAEAIAASGKLVAMIGIENGQPLGRTPDEIRERVALWAARGARYASLTHFGHNQFGGSSNPSRARREAPDDGLSDLGRVLVEALNDHGIMVDISHVGARTAAEAMALSRAPVIASHSSVKAVHDNPRGLSDDQLRAIAAQGGVAQIVAYRPYVAAVNPRLAEAMDVLRARLGLRSGDDFAAAPAAVLEEYRRERARLRTLHGDVPLARFLDHVDHAVRVAGIDHVGLSGDFDGGGGVAGWDGAAETPNVTAALLARGYDESDLAKLWGGNLLRVMRAVEAAAAR
jgi:membrane dipeptidase